MAWRGGLLVLIALLPGCQTPSRISKDITLKQATVVNSCSLLHQLLSQEKDVSLLRFIKKEDGDLKDLIKQVAAVSRIGADQLENFAKQDRSLLLDNYRLPPGEQQTRDVIGAVKQKELLHQSGGRFEITLLLTQIEALNYAWGLAKVAGENDSRPERIAYLMGLSKQMGDLRDELTALLVMKSKEIAQIPAK